MKTLWIYGLVVFTSLSGFTFAQDADQPGKGITLEPGLATWDSAIPTDAIFHALLEELGYRVKDSTALANPIFYQAVMQGDVAYWTDGWFPIHNSQTPEGFEEFAEKEAGIVVEGGALQGYLIDKKSADAFGITSLEDFKRPEVQEAFDADGDGKADLVACPPGWGCELTIDHHIEAYGLEEHVNLIKAAYNASFADALARYNNDEPVFFYTWTPNFTTFQLAPGEDVVWINVPEIAPTEAQEGYEDSMVVADVEGAVSNPLTMGFIANNITIVANKEFLAENPAAATLFAEASLPLADITEMTTRISEGEDSDRDIRKMAEEWIENNREQVDGWLEAARAAAQ